MDQIKVESIRYQTGSVFWTGIYSGRRVTQITNMLTFGDFFFEPGVTSFGSGPTRMVLWLLGWSAFANAHCLPHRTEVSTGYSTSLNH